jgi:hypothetical protein
LRRAGIRVIDIEGLPRPRLLAPSTLPPLMFLPAGVVGLWREALLALLAGELLIGVYGEPLVTDRLIGAVPAPPLEETG